MITLAIDYRAAVPLSSSKPSHHHSISQSELKKVKTVTVKSTVKYTSVKGVATGENQHSPVNQFLSCCTERRQLPHTMSCRKLPLRVMNHDPCFDLYATSYRTGGSSAVGRQNITTPWQLCSHAGAVFNLLNPDFFTPSNQHTFLLYEILSSQCCFVHIFELVNY